MHLHLNLCSVHILYSCIEWLSKKTPTNPYFWVIWFCLTYLSQCRGRWSILLAAPVPAARGSAACPGEAGPCWSHSSPSPSPAVRVLWCCRAAPPDISCERGLVFFQNTVYYRFHNQFLLDLCRSPCGTPGLVLLAGGSGADPEGARGLIFPAWLGKRAAGSSASRPRWPSYF